MCGMIAAALVDLVCVTYDWVYRTTLLDSAELTEEEAQGLDILWDFTAACQAGAAILATILFLVWLYRAVANVSLLPLGRCRFSPAGAVGWFFVPVICLVQGYRVVKELWVASGSELPGQDPERLRSAFLVKVWWSCLLGSVVCTFRGGVALERATTVEAVSKAFQSLIAGDLLHLGFAILSVMLVAEVRRMQNQRYYSRVTPMRLVGAVC